MTEAPERIWAMPARCLMWVEDTTGGVHVRGCHEYIRADLVDPAAIREAALREAAGMVDDDMWVTPWELQDMILALIEKKKEDTTNDQTE